MVASRLDVIKQISDLAHAKLPQTLHGRLERATAIVLHQMIEPAADGTWRVAHSTGTGFHLVNGQCDCQDSPRAPEGYCKPRLSILIFRRVEQLTQQAPPVQAAVSASGTTGRHVPNSGRNLDRPGGFSGHIDAIPARGTGVGHGAPDHRWASRRPLHAARCGRGAPADPAGGVAPALPADRSAAGPATHLGAEPERLVP